MTRIRKCFITILIALGHHFVTAQSAIIDCSKDSVEFQMLLRYLSATDVENSYMDDVENQILDKEVKKDCFCTLLIYTRIFDNLLLNGLDLNYNYAKNPPVHNSTNLPPDDEYIVKLNDTNRKYELYHNFLMLKILFEENVVAKYEADKGRSLERDVNNILSYSVYCRPKDLRNILLTKNAQLLEEKLVKETELILGKD